MPINSDNSCSTSSFSLSVAPNVLVSEMLKSEATKHELRCWTNCFNCEGVGYFSFVLKTLSRCNFTSSMMALSLSALACSTRFTAKPPFCSSMLRRWCIEMCSDNFCSRPSSNDF